MREAKVRAMEHLVTEGRRIRLALTFLTRLPLGGADWSPQDFRGSVLWFPVAGLVIGLAQGAVAWAASALFPAEICGALAVITGVLVSGGLHLDGLMDTFDGLGSGKPPPEALDIMRDTRVGAFGVTAAILVILLQFAAAVSLARRGYPLLFAGYSVGTCLSRMSLSLATAAYPYRRSQGVGALFRGAGTRELVGALALGAAAGWLFLHWAGLVLLLLSLLFALAFCHLMRRLFGGLTGDIYGALAELETAALLLSAVALLGGLPVAGDQ